jgi:23S rRNA (guanosine2251-2'-O)-methyltransferase
MDGKALRRKKEVKDLMRGFASQHDRDIELTFLLQDWTDGYNVGGLLRVADALGIEEVYASGNTPVPPNPMISVTSMGAHRRVEVHHHAIHEEAAKLALADGWTLVAVELADRAVPYFQLEYPQRTCLVLGSEGAGLYKSVLKLCEAAVYVPMAGKGRSMNVHVTGAVVAFHAQASRTTPAEVQEPNQTPE